MKAYRLSLFLADLAWQDATQLVKDRRTTALADQLYRAVGSIGANIAEGYSRGSGRDQARFYEYALGSAREARDWYFKARHVLGDHVIDSRLIPLAEISRLLLAIVSLQRTRSLREDPVLYDNGE
jgi:four helix bundle protein